MTYDFNPNGSMLPVNHVHFENKLSRFFVPAILVMSSYCLRGGVFLYHTRLRLGPPG